MRWICGASALLAVCGLISPAVGQEAPWGGGPRCTNCEQYHTLGAPACASPFLGWVPGCYECPPSACDNAWATYCYEKAKWKAFWSRVGTGAFCDRPMPVAYQPTPAIYQPTGHALPAIPDAPDPPEEQLQPVGPVEPEKPIRLPPVPEPVPEETTWRLNRPWRH